MTVMPPTPPAWQELDDRAVAVVRGLAMDAVQKVGNGHPGTAMSLAPVAYTLFQRFLRHDPSDPSWIGRDRFVLSCGHSSLTLYIQLLFSGYGLSLEDLKAFRTWGSQTPGHPEYGHTPGVETTTGPLGQGIANAVGLAMAARFKRGLLDPNEKAGNSPFDHNIWVICSDGDIQEGVSAEASSLAGTQALGSLKLIYDDNRISIDGDTHNAFTEDVSGRYRAYGWNVIEVPALSDGNVDRISLEEAMVKACEEIARPTLIRLKSVIAWPAPKAKNTAKSHGSALGAEEVSATKKVLGLHDETFHYPSEIRTHVEEVKKRNSELRKIWQSKLETWRVENPDKYQLLDRLQNQQLPKEIESAFPVFEAGKEIATRKASGEVINKIARMLPELIGGSADLAESNNTFIEAGGSFLPTGSSMKDANPYGRNIFFGIREHAMAAILNGMALHGGVIPFGGTFLVFSDYMRGAVRLSSLMKLPVIYIWTHDSIGLGEDGPTHQPVEHLAALRAIPGLNIVRPADANEVSIAWRETLRRKKPTGIVLSRQNLPVLDRNIYGGAEGVSKGAYILLEAKEPTLLMIATGSEVSLALSAAAELNAKGERVQVVSAPCLEWFHEQPIEYREKVWPTRVKARVSIEAGIAQGWRDFIGDIGESVSIEHFGASAAHIKLFEEFGFTVSRVVAAAQKTLLKAR
ncbi:MAG: transketolase [Actinobacteria bacterium]|nr:transketolase [Actinomycetota bacterium]